MRIVFGLVFLLVVVYLAALYNEQVITTVSSFQSFFNQLMVQYDPWSWYVIQGLGFGLPAVAGLVIAARPLRRMKKLLASITGGKISDAQYTELLELQGMYATAMGLICLLTAIFVAFATSGLIWGYVQLYCR